MPLVRETVLVPSPSAVLFVMRSVPPLTFTPPSKVFVPLKTTVPALIRQSICTPPVPVMAFGTVSVPVRSKRSVPLLITSPVPRLPLAPSLPICSVPALIVVSPV